MASKKELVFQVRFNGSLPKNYETQIVGLAERFNLKINISKAVFLENNIVRCLQIKEND